MGLALFFKKGWKLFKCKFKVTSKKSTCFILELILTLRCKDLNTMDPFPQLVNFVTGRIIHYHQTMVSINPYIIKTNFIVNCEIV